MAVRVYLQKRKSRGRKSAYFLRWKEDGQWKSESTGLTDRAKAIPLQTRKWELLNKLREPEPVPVAPPVKASWDECRDAFKRAMAADNLRPATIEDAVTTWKGLQDTINLIKQTNPKSPFAAIEAPADVTPEMVNEYKRRRMESGLSAWTVSGDLSALRAVFGKWLCDECGLLKSNPFEKVRKPKCDEPDIRIVMAQESQALVQWFNDRWNNWKLPIVYLDVAATVGWRATEVASLREQDLLGKGYVQCIPTACKTRRLKYGWLPDDLYADLAACVAGGYAFGKFADQLRRRLLMVRLAPNAAATVKDFDPGRLVGWLQDELKRFNVEQAQAAAKAKATWEPFTLHDYRRTAITGLQMAGVSEKECSTMVGASPEVIRRHYARLDGMTIAKRSVERRVAAQKADSNSENCAHPLRAQQKTGS